MTFVRPDLRHLLFSVIAFALLLLPAAGCAPTVPPSVAGRSVQAPPPRDYLFHLPGIAGEQNLDRRFIAGLREGGYAGTIEIYDWTQQDPGIRALLARERNQKQAANLAAKLENILTQEPNARIRLVCHSGGAGIAVWALERLPANMQIETLVFVAPALSQKYDLSKALAHVRGNAFALTSVNDVLVLGAGTRMLGTIDGVKEEAAGMRGFTKPAGADDAQYAKLVTMPYREEWMDLDNIGDHIGPMGRTFAKAFISRLVQGRNVPPAATTRGAPGEPGRGEAHRRDQSMQNRRPQHARGQ